MKKIRFLLYTLYVTVAWKIRQLTKQKADPNKPIDLFFAMTDHYEPGTNGVPEAEERERVDFLLKRYPEIVDRFKDHDGRVAKRTWFYPPHYHRYGALRKLVKLCDDGYGEVEIHLHHGKHEPDTPENLRETLLEIVKDYEQFGIFGQVNGESKYGFIHGDWALANSRGGQFCGVNEEIDILRETGCYADYTHPSRPETTPRQINSIYYAEGWRDKPKSYNRGIEAEAGKPGDESDRLLLIQGPLHPLQLTEKLSSVRPIGDEVAGSPYTTEARIKKWIETGVHVKGNPNWVFIKTHTHGATDADSVLGEEFEQILKHLTEHYNDGRRYRLHFVTAREMYNLVKAVEDGKSDQDPITLMDYIVKPPKYNTACDVDAASDKLQALVWKTYRG